MNLILENHGRFMVGSVGMDMIIGMLISGKNARMILDLIINIDSRASDETDIMRLHDMEGAVLRAIEAAKGIIEGFVGRWLERNPV